ncbi:ependymin-2-like [Xiphophorus couchianus]|uniref:ependymin-2-like n=1 Tax=Xiphophorus couchianus TaxID=32473 RepID=UPI001015D2AA|nr:ependymin-2-like [Xiphophorus couchianus]
MFEVQEGAIVLGILYTSITLCARLWFYKSSCWFTDRQMCSWLLPFLPSLTLFCHRCWIRKMFATVALLVFMCLTTTTHADHHHEPCHTHNMTGFMSVMNLKGETKAFGSFTYDSVGRKLRFSSNESHPADTSLDLDLLMLFDEGIFYEIDIKNHSCEKKKLQMPLHPFDIPDDAKFHSTVTTGSSSIKGEGLKVNIWTGSLTNMKGSYSMSVTTGCLPVSTFYFTETTSFFFSNMDVKLEIKDPDLLVVPSICLEKPVEDTPEGTVNSFLNEFM